MNSNVKIRVANENDAAQLLKIYAYYVKNTALTFEYSEPSLAEFKSRVTNTLNFYPYLVAESENEIIGYAYAGRYHSRAAYAWNAEMTVYLKNNLLRNGVGTQLYTRLEQILNEQGFVKTIALITFPVDKYSDFNSMQFHEKMGYKLSGKLEYCGYKFNRWYSTIFMDKMIGTPTNNMRNVIPFNEVKYKFNF